MARKHLIYSYKMIDQGDMSDDITSSVVEVSQLDNASIYVEWDSSPDGEVFVDAKNGDNSSFYTLDFNDAMTINTTPQYIQLVFEKLPFTHIRLRYIRNSGSGTLNAIITSKTEGA